MRSEEKGNVRMRTLLLLLDAIRGKGIQNLTYHCPCGQLTCTHCNATQCMCSSICSETYKSQCELSFPQCHRKTYISWAVRPSRSDQKMMSCELCMSSVIEKLLSLPLQERLSRSARHWSPSLTNIIMIRKINLCLSQTGQHYCIIRMRRQLLWECNTSHRYGVEGEIRNIKPTVSPDIRMLEILPKSWQVSRRLDDFCVTAQPVA